MKLLVLNGTDARDGSPVTVSARLEDAVAAKRFASEHGFLLVSVQTEDGRDLTPHAPAESNPDLPLYIVALVVPILGLVAGIACVLMRRKSGTGIMLASVIGAALWICIAALH